MFSYLRLLPRSMEQPKFSLLLPSTPSIKQQKHFRFLYSSCGNMKCKISTRASRSCGLWDPQIHALWTSPFLSGNLSVKLKNGTVYTYGWHFSLSFLSIFIPFFTKFFGPLTFGDVLHHTPSFLPYHGARQYLPWLHTVQIQDLAGRKFAQSFQSHISHPSAVPSNLQLLTMLSVRNLMRCQTAIAFIHSCHCFSDLRERQINKYTQQNKYTVWVAWDTRQNPHICSHTNPLLLVPGMENSSRMGGRWDAAASGKPAGGIQCNHACRKLQAWLVLLSEQQVESFAKPSPLEGLLDVIYLFLFWNWTEMWWKSSQSLQTASVANPTQGPWSGTGTLSEILQLLAIRGSIRTGNSIEGAI